MNWPVVPITKVARVVGGATPKSDNPNFWGGNIEWATPKDLSNLSEKYLSATPRKITEAGLKGCAAEILPVGSVLFSSRAPIGHIAINTVPMATNQGFKSFVPGSELDASFLYWWLDANRERLQAMGTGATFKEVSKAVVERIEIPLPPLADQRRIAGILDQADSLCRLRTRALDKLNTLGQAIFQEMFGDISNSTAKLKTLGTILTGSTPDTSVEEYFLGDIPFITPGDLESDRDFSRYVSEDGAKASRVVLPGATLVCCIGATIGKMDIVRRRAAFNQQINAVQWGDKISPEYGYFALQLKRAEIKKIGQGAATTLPIIKKSLFQDIEIPVASYEGQLKFSDIYGQICERLTEYRTSSSTLDSLFASLQHQAFRGEL